MIYDITKSTCPVEMPNLGRGLEAPRLLLSPTSKDMHPGDKGTNFICNFAFKIEKTAKNTRYSEKNVYLCGVNLRIE